MPLHLPDCRCEKRINNTDKIECPTLGLWSEKDRGIYGHHRRVQKSAEMAGVLETEKLGGLVSLVTLDRRGK